MSPNFYAVRTEPNREFTARDDLQDRGIAEIYLPVSEDHTMRRGKVEIAFRPIVRGYIFPKVEMTAEMFHVIADARGVSGIIQNNFRPVPISEAAIDAMRGECDKLVRMTGDVPDLDWMMGQTFMIKSGVWESYSGPCTGFDNRDVPLILLPICNRLEPVPVPLVNLHLTPIETEFDMIPTKPYKRMSRQVERQATA